MKAWEITAIGFCLYSLLVTKKEMVEEDGDLQLRKIISGALSGSKSKGKERARSRRVTLKIFQ